MSDPVLPWKNLLQGNFKRGAFVAVVIGGSAALIRLYLKTRNGKRAVATASKSASASASASAGGRRERVNIDMAFFRVSVLFISFFFSS
jgi:hypothetical protein